MFCVGATKAGTSWLYNHLAAHPDCHFRTIKELHYFSMTEPANFAAALEQIDSRLAFLAGRILNTEGAEQSNLTRQFADLTEWRAVLAEMRPNIAAYKQFLTKDLGAARLVGDVTPAYALLQGAALKKLNDVAADVRVVFLLRDPLDRLWSHVRMSAERAGAKADFEAYCESLLGRILDGEATQECKGIVKRGDYAKIIPKLQRAFDADRLLILQQDELLTPAGIEKLSKFLGITAQEAAFDRRVHAGKPLSMSEGLRARAAKWLRPQYDFLASTFPALPVAWHLNMEKGFA